MAAMRSRSYRVVFERDESGAWIAQVPRVRGCHTYGRTLEQARRRIREALALWVEDAASVEFAEEVRLPTEARDAIKRSRQARKAAEARRIDAQVVTAEAAQALVGDLQLSVRDAGELLGLSHQRVQQLVRG